MSKGAWGTEQPRWQPDIELRPETEQSKRARLPSKGRKGRGDGDVLGDPPTRHTEQPRLPGEPATDPPPALAHPNRPIPASREDEKWSETWERASQYPMPEWVKELRPHQVEAILDVVEAFDRGAKVVFLDAPTGSGKTLIAEGVRRIVANVASQTIYTCTTKGLQDQFLRDYQYAKVIKGRVNYPTQMGGPEITADDCEGEECNWCWSRGSCPYQIAKGKAERAELSVLNTAYLLATNNMVGAFLGRDLVVIDECDVLENSLMGYVEVRVSKRRVEQIGLGYPKKTVKKDWKSWLEKAIPVVKRLVDEVDVGLGVQEARELKRREKLLGNLIRLEKELWEDDERWVYMEEMGNMVWKPVMVDKWGEDVLWKHHKKFLLMSASIVSPREMVESLGIDGQWEVVNVPSTFPVENRMVHVAGLGRMTWKQREETMPRMLAGIEKVLEAHEGDRVLVHTVSYQLSRDIFEYLRDRGVGEERPLVRYKAGKWREEALDLYMKEERAVMIAPSMDRGVDLPGDLCRVQVIVKVPSPYLKDKQVNQRLYGTKGGKLWFAVQTARTIIQMTGRGVRNKDDWAETYVLDSFFVSFYKQWKSLFPEYWKEALVWDGRKRRELDL